MHVIHTKAKHRGKIKIICNEDLVIRSSVHDLQKFCEATNTYVDINDGVHMTLLPETEE